MADDAQAPLVLAYDGSEGARAAIDHAVRLFPGRRVLVLTVWDTITGAAPASGLALPADISREACEKIDGASERKARTTAEEGAGRLQRGGLDASGAAVLSNGSTWSTIAAHAHDQGAGAIVVGSRGHSGLRSALLGSVSNSLVHNASVPVLVVHAPEA